MNRLSELTSVAENSRATRAPWLWRQAALPVADPPEGSQHPDTPRALWRLVNIGEMAGLLVASPEAATLASFRPGEPRRAAIDAELRRFKCCLTDLYVLVTLFAAAPRPVPFSILLRETQADAPALRRSLEYLEAAGAISSQTGGPADPTWEFTVSGLNLATLLMYRMINCCVMPYY